MEAAAQRNQARFERERELDRLAEAERLRAAARRPIGENLEEGLRLIEFAQRFQAGFGRGSAGGR